MEFVYSFHLHWCIKCPTVTVRTPMLCISWVSRSCARCHVVCQSVHLLLTGILCRNGLTYLRNSLNVCQPHRSSHPSCFPSTKQRFEILMRSQRMHVNTAVNF